MHPWIYYTIELRHDREREARITRLAREAAMGRHKRPSLTRRTTARALAALTRGSANAVRRLDDCVADDLQHALAASE